MDQHANLPQTLLSKDHSSELQKGRALYLDLLQKSLIGSLETSKAGAPVICLLDFKCFFRSSCALLLKVPLLVSAPLMVQKEAHHPSPLSQAAPDSQRKENTVPTGETILVMQDLQAASPVAVPHMRQGPDLQSWFAAYMSDQAHLAFWRREGGQGTKIATEASCMQKFCSR